MSHEIDIDIENMPDLEDGDISKQVRKMLTGLGEDPNREGLVRTIAYFEERLAA